ncbi:MAG: phosphoribosylformylglycinamidine cyclo-ligase [Deltaproteobacteria bacterium]
MPGGLTYKDAGVDIERGDALVERIKTAAARTRGPEVLEGIGGFAALVQLKPILEAAGGMDDPLLVSGTDGVGTKLAVAFAMNRHDFIGQDLVAMCVNDVLTTGARPLFFLDYFATGGLDLDVAAEVVEGIARACTNAGCALVGGETAEMPGLYQPGEYDLAGFAVGIVDRKNLIAGQDVKAGDAVVGVASTGIHSNGLSLARKVFVDHAGLDYKDTVDEIGTTIGDALLVPTALYTDAVHRMIAKAAPKALAHITGGGIPGNLPRVLPDALGARIDKSTFALPGILRALQRLGGVDEDEMFSTFNMGLGLMAVVDPANADAAIEAARAAGHEASVVGEITDVPGVTIEGA